ncbi:MAG TPA: J domain-containing protein [Bdellovibrionota bacterium]|nr:J domain-containing protein [Bdellovibrionota bacterium]
MAQWRTLLPAALRSRLLLRALRCGDDRAASAWAVGLRGFAVLALVARTGSADLLRSLLLADAGAIARGASWRPDGRHSDGGGRLLLEAIRSPRQSLEKVRVLLAAGADANAASLPGGATPLTFALAEGRLELVSLLLEEGADPVKPDRRGIPPMAIAVLKEDRAAISRLAAAGAPDAAAGAEEAERAFLQQRPLHAEVHEIVKWAIRASGFTLERMRIPGLWAAGGETQVVYEFARWRIRLVFHDDSGTLSLALEDPASGKPVADLLPKGQSVTSASLRGHLVTMLKWAHSPGATGASREPAPAGAEPGSAWERLGLAEGASSEEIRKAYRKLAKAYHPDRAAPADRAEAEKRMRELNRAYEEVGPKRR